MTFFYCRMLRLFYMSILGATFISALIAHAQEESRFTQVELALASISVNLGPQSKKCTGFLVAPDLVVTAGHCLTSKQGLAIPCSQVKLSFKSASGAEEYACENIVAIEYSHYRPISLSIQDEANYAILQLDRVAHGREPLVLQSAPIKPKTPVIVAKHSTSKPMPLQLSREDNPYIGWRGKMLSHQAGAPVLNAESLEVMGVLVSNKKQNFGQLALATKASVISHALPQEPNRLVMVEQTGHPQPLRAGKEPLGIFEKCINLLKLPTPLTP